MKNNEDLEMKTFNKIAIALGILLALVVLTKGATAIGNICEHCVEYPDFCPQCLPSNETI